MHLPYDTAAKRLMMMLPFNAKLFSISVHAYNSSIDRLANEKLLLVSV